MNVKQLQGWVPDWDAVRDQQVRKAEHESGIELRQLAGIQKEKQARRGVVARSFIGRGHQVWSLIGVREPLWQ